MKNPTMLYKHPGPHEIHGSHFDYVIVDAGEDGQLEKAIADGWSLTTPEALQKAGPSPVIPDDNAPPTREELITKAKELGLSFGPNTSSKKLGDMIESALAEKPKE